MLRLADHNNGSANVTAIGTTHRRPVFPAQMSINRAAASRGTSGMAIESDEEGMSDEARGVPSHRTTGRG